MHLPTRRRLGEPNATIYTRNWQRAVQRLVCLDGRERKAFTNVMALVNAAWKHLRTLQHYVEDQSAQEARPYPLSVFVEFVDAEVVNPFRDLAYSAAEYVPDAPEADDEADPDNLDADASLIGRRIEVLYLAVEAQAVPDEFRNAVHRCRNALAGWANEFGAAVAETVAPSGIQPREPSSRDDAA